MKKKQKTEKAQKRKRENEEKKRKKNKLNCNPREVTTTHKSAPRAIRACAEGLRSKMYSGLVHDLKNQGYT
jgi:hypothetical protein